MTVEMQRPREVRPQLPVALVDCDVHPFLSEAELAEYVAEPWRSRYFSGDPCSVEMSAAIYQPPRALRADAITPDGKPPATDRGFLEQQLFQETGVDVAILMTVTPRAKLGQPELETALCAGQNAWLAATWLSGQTGCGRFRGSIRVSPNDPVQAAAEIAKWAEHPYMAQVFMAPEGSEALGQPRFRPIIAAAAHAHLPLTLHISRIPSMRALTPVGYPSYHLEIYPQWPMYFMNHLASLVFEGVFDEYPSLRIVFVEGGFAWVMPFVWRLDRYWEALGGPASGARRRPSEYLADHVRFTTQPVEEPQPPRALGEMMEWIDAERMLMFATDYPHYDFDDPSWAMRRFAAGQDTRIFARNAIELYGLPETRDADSIDRAAGRVDDAESAA